MLHADARPVPILETRRALNRSLLLHVIVLGLVLGLPYLHKPPTVEEPPVVQAVLVAPAVVKRPEPVPEPMPEPVAPPPPVPEKLVMPEPVREPPKIALPKAPEKPVPKIAEKTPPRPVEKKPPTPIIKNLKPSTAAMDDEMEAIRRDMQQAEMNRLRREMETSATAMKVSANAALVDRYRGLIAQRVESKWARPLSARAGMTVTLRISILPGGEVANDPIVVSSSGDAAFDSSAIEAVRRASPLPVPDDAAVFSQNFRTFTMKFRPEDL